MQNGYSDLWPILLAVIQFGGAIGAAIHAMLIKSDERAAAGWVGFIVLVPFVGWIVYLLFGVNRIQRRARELRGQKNETLLLAPLPARGGGRVTVDEGPRLKALEKSRPLRTKSAAGKFRAGQFRRRVEKWRRGLSSMIAAIESAERSIALSTYIFNNDPAKPPLRRSPVGGE